MSKVQKKDGARIKFIDPEDMFANLVAVDVSDLIIECIDPWDCVLACYGDNGVEENYLKRDVRGVFEYPLQDGFLESSKLGRRFLNIQSVLNGVVFLFRARNKSRISTKLRYFFAPNCQITSFDKQQKIRSMLDQLFPKYS